MPRIAVIALLLIALCLSAVGQTTSVTLVALDADSQSWNNGTWSASLYSPPGVPQGPYVILGGSTPVPNQQQTGLLNGSGTASLTVTPNTSISPSGTQWTFVFCPQATPAACSQFPTTVSGASQNVAPTLPAIRLSVTNPVIRVTAYADAEITGAAVGSIYFNLTDQTIHVCTTFVAPGCTAWSVVGTGGGGGGITGLTPQVIPQAATPTTIQNSSPQLDNGLTALNTLTYAGANGFNLPSDGVHAGSIQIGGNTTLPSFANNAWGWIGPASASFTSYFFQPPSTGAVAGKTFLFGTPVGNIVPLTYVTPVTTGGSAPAAQVGDTLRFNVNGDSAYDAVNMAQMVEGIYAVNQTGTLYVGGGPYQGQGPTATPLGSTSDVNPTATSNSGKTISASAAGSTSTVIGMAFGHNGSVSLMGIEAFYRWSFKAALGNTTSVRYWMGLACFHSGGAGNNAAQITGSTAYANDTPNKSTLGFRFSAGTDTHWQAVAITAGGSQTTTDTGVTPDTGVHLFEMTTNATGTSITYWIDNVSVATISTNLPPPANLGDSWGSRFFTGDNKNTATAISLTFYSMQTSMK